MSWMSPICSGSTSVARYGRANTFCISPTLRRRRWDKLARGIEPELIVMLSDINMPDMDGLALLREVKESRPDLPVIMVTAYGDEGRRRRAKECGAAFFITKPVDFDFLKAQLRQLTLPPASSRNQ